MVWWRDFRLSGTGDPDQRRLRPHLDGANPCFPGGATPCEFPSALLRCLHSPGRERGGPRGTPPRCARSSGPAPTRPCDRSASAPEVAGRREKERCLKRLCHPRMAWQQAQTYICHMWFGWCTWRRMQVGLRHFGSPRSFLPAATAVMPFPANCARRRWRSAWGPVSRRPASGLIRPQRPAGEGGNGNLYIVVTTWLTQHGRNFVHEFDVLERQNRLTECQCSGLQSSTCARRPDVIPSGIGEALFRAWPWRKPFGVAVSPARSQRPSTPTGRLASSCARETGRYHVVCP